MKQGDQLYTTQTQQKKEDYEEELSEVDLIDRCSSFAIPHCDFAYKMGNVGVIAHGKQRIEHKEFVDGVLDGMQIPRNYYSPEDGPVCKDCHANVLYFPGSIVMYHFNDLITQPMRKQIFNAVHNGGQNNPHTTRNNNNNNNNDDPPTVNNSNKNGANSTAKKTDGGISRPQPNARRNIPHPNKLTNQTIDPLYEWRYYDGVSLTSD